MKKCAVIIGVNKTGKMQELSAAVSGAKQFQKWASSQNYDTILITDESKKVTIQNIKDAINKFVDKNYSLMIIFFSGHGILKGIGDEKWLLSNAPRDVNEAVNVLPSKILASTIGIPHVVFISDSCRSIPDHPLISQVTGQVITPNIDSNTRSDVDIFYATRPGSPAFEVKASKAVKSFKGIFTDCLLEGLSGTVTSTLTKITDEDGNKAKIVLPHKLGEYLHTAVPLKALEKRIPINQDPVSEITSHSPKYLSKFIDDKKSKSSKQVKEVTSKTKKKVNTLQFDSKVKDKKNLEKLNQEIKTKNKIKKIENIEDILVRNRISTSKISDLRRLLNLSVGKESYETRTGFTIIGEDYFDALITNHDFEILDQNNTKHIRILSRKIDYQYYYESALKDKPITLFLVLKNGTGIPLAVLPGFIGTVVLKDSQVININYFPSRGTPKYSMAYERRKSIEERRNNIALSARYGLFKPEGSSFQVMDFASYLRNNKSFDPTLGLYAAYAYAQAGRYRDIHSIYEYMRREKEPVIFDVTMLTLVLTPPNPNLSLQKAKVSPMCPMLTQGWSYLSIDYNFFPSYLQELGKYLIPGLWTTFNEKGVSLLEKLIKDRVIK